MRPAIGQIFGRGDGKKAGEFRRRRADAGYRLPDIVAHLGHTGTQCGMIAFGNAPQFGMLLKKRQRHGPRFIQVHINAHALRRGTFGQFTQPFQALFPFDTEIRLPRERRQGIEYALKPHTVDAGSVEPFEVIFREGILFDEGVTIQGEVRVTEPWMKQGFAGLFRPSVNRGGEVLHKRQGRVWCHACRITEESLDLGSNLGSPGLGSFGRRRPGQRRAGRLQAAQLDKQEVIFLQGICQVRRIPTEQNQQLVIVQQVPVGPDYGDVSALQL